MNTHEHILFQIYLKWLLSFGCLLLCACAIFNWYIDPYDLFGRPRIEGLNNFKPTAETRVRLTKPYRVSDIKPQTLILGNSRPEIGINPGYVCWPEKNQPVYNSCMLGTGLYSAYRNFQHALSETDIQHMLLGVDFLFFVQDNKNLNPHHWNQSDQEFEHLSILVDGSENPKYVRNRVVNMFKALFSMRTVADSIHTMVEQDNPTAPTVNLDGHNPGRQFLDIVAAEGQQVLFTQKNLEVANLLSKPKYIFQGGKRWSKSFEILLRILELAKKNKTSVTLFINPRHADFINLINISGKWKLLEEWKRVLTVLAEKYNADLWDFHEFNEFSTPAPPNRTGQVLAGFWEPGHYRSALGDVMIDNMFDNYCKKTQRKKLGTRLKLDNIEPHLIKLREQLSNYSKSNPYATQQLRTLYNTVENKIN